MREEEAAQSRPPTRAQRRKWAKMQTAEDEVVGNEASASEKKGEEPEKQPKMEENPAKKAKKQMRK